MEEIDQCSTIKPVSNQSDEESLEFEEKSPIAINWLDESLELGGEDSESGSAEFNS